MSYIRTLVGGVLPFCRDAVSVFYSPCWLDHRTLVGGVLPFCRDAVGVFYSPSRRGNAFYWAVASKIYLKQQVALLCSSHLAFSPRVSLVHPCRSTNTNTAWDIRWSILDQYVYVDTAFSWDITAEVCEMIYLFQKHTTWNGDGSNFNLSSRWSQSLPLLSSSNAQFTRLGQVYLREALDHLLSRHLS